MKKMSHLFLPCLFLAVWVTGPAAAQTQNSVAGLYRAVEDGGGEVFLVRLEFVARTNPTGVVATVFDRTGGYLVLGGFIDRGGLNIPFTFLYPARDPYRMLRTPAQQLRNWQQTLDLNGLRCQVDLVFVRPGEVIYRCPDSTGRLIKLRS
jgi:hypothetical protein